MTTERHAWYSTQPPAAFSATVLLVCGCGQDVDEARRRNCTRCGISLMPVHAALECR